MTKLYGFNKNQIYTDQETYDALVSHFNKIENIAKNKKFEWEDADPTTETYNITYDFDEWLGYVENLLEKYVYEGYKFREIYNDHYITPENLHNDLIDYTNQLKDYVDGFVLGPVGMYEGKSFTTKTYRGDTFDEIVEYMKQLRQNNKMVFLYQVYEKTKRPNDISIEEEGYTRTLRQDLSTCYLVSCGVLND